MQLNFKEVFQQETHLKPMNFSLCRAALEKVIDFHAHITSLPPGPSLLLTWLNLNLSMDK